MTAINGRPFNLGRQRFDYTGFPLIDCHLNLKNLVLFFALRSSEFFHLLLHMEQSAYSVQLEDSLTYKRSWNNLRFRSYIIVRLM